MNEYLIDYIDNEDGEKANDAVTAHNMEAAIEYFKSYWIDDSFYTIKRIELLRTGVPPTREKEHDTLKVIMKMVKELGPSSSGTAPFPVALKSQNL